jgi:hypothetical protein
VALLHNCIFGGVLAGFAILANGYAPARQHPPGQIAPRAPNQTMLDDARPIAVGPFTLQPRARFDIEARVLLSTRYRFDQIASLIPLDMAVGWGPMSDSTLIDQLAMVQGNRFLNWWPRRKQPAPHDVINRSSANMHLIPATPAVAKVLLRARSGDLVVIRGDLVDVIKGERLSMQTSLSREDSGAGACEIVYVRSAEIRP